MTVYLQKFLSGCLSEIKNSSERHKTKARDNVSKALEALSSQFPEEWIKESDKEDYRAWTDCYDRYHPSYSVAITRYIGENSDLRFVISRRVPSTGEPDCDISNTYKIKISREKKEIFFLLKDETLEGNNARNTGRKITTDL